MSIRIIAVKVTVVSLVWGCLAGYLVKHRYFGSDEIDIRIEQGYEIGRPSLLFLKAEQNQGQIDVSVGGKVIMVAKGELT